MKVAWTGLAFLLGLQDSPADLLRRSAWRGVDALAEKGEEARPALEALVRDPDSDVAFYARAALAELQGRAGPGRAALVRTREIRNVSAVDALGALFRAAGLELAAGDLPDRPITLADGLPLLEALEEASRRLDVEFYLSGTGAWRATSGYLRAPRFAFRQFRIRFDQIQHEFRNDFEHPPSGFCRLRGRFESDGGARLLSLSNIRILQAKDDRGNDLIRPKGDAGQYQALPEGPTITLDLLPPDAEASSLARLRLSLDVTLEKQSALVSLDSKNPEAKLGSRVLRLRGMEREQERWRVVVDALPPPAQRLSAALVDAQGRTFELVSADNTSVTFRNPGGLGDPVRFSVCAVTETFTRPVFLELKDVPLQ